MDRLLRTEARTNDNQLIAQDHTSKLSSGRAAVEPFCELANDKSTARSLPNLPPVFCISHVYSHHAGASGYHHLAKYLGNVAECGPILRFLGETVLRVPTKLAGWYCGSYDYSRHNCTAELSIGLHLLRRRGTIYHFLYGEKSYRFSGFLNGVRGNRLIASYHHAPSRFDEMSSYKRHLRFLEHAVAMASNQVEYLERWVGRGRVSVVPHGVDTEYWVPREQRGNEKLLRCVFAGTHMRDYETLDRVVNRVSSAPAQVEFVLLSSDKRCASIASRPNVRWLPRCSDEEYRSQMQMGDLLVLPLTDSTAVNSVLEGLACGLPTITNQGGVVEYLSPECSRVYSVGEAEIMADAILDLALDRRQLSAMQTAARTQALNFSWPLIAERMREVYRTIWQ